MLSHSYITGGALLSWAGSSARMTARPSWETPCSERTLRFRWLSSTWIPTEQTKFNRPMRPQAYNKEVPLVKPYRKTGKRGGWMCLPPLPTHYPPSLLDPRPPHSTRRTPPKNTLFILPRSVSPRKRPYIPRRLKQQPPSPKLPLRQTIQRLMASYL